MTTIPQTLQQAISVCKTKQELTPLIRQWFIEQFNIPIRDRRIPRTPLWAEMCYDNEQEFDAYLDKYFDLHYFQSGLIYMIIEA
jgi:hypothetical protein